MPSMSDTATLTPGMGDFSTSATIALGLRARRRGLLGLERGGREARILSPARQAGTARMAESAASTMRPCDPSLRCTSP